MAEPRIGELHVVFTAPLSDEAMFLPLHFASLKIVAVVPSNRIGFFIVFGLVDVKI